MTIERARYFACHFFIMYLLLLPALATASPVKQFKVTAAKKSDTVVLKALVPEDVFNKTTSWNLRIDNSVFTIPASAFTTKKSGISLLKLPKKDGGITRGKYIPRKGSLILKGNKVNLRDIPATFELSLNGQDFSSCSTVQLRQRNVRRRNAKGRIVKQKMLIKKAVAGECDERVSVTVNPVTLLPGEQKNIRVQVLVDEAAHALGTVAVLVAQEGKSKAPTFFCEAQDDGNAGSSGDLEVGDGIFTCTAPFQAGKRQGAYLFSAQADLDGRTLASRATRLYVQRKLEASTANRIVTNQGRLLEIWQKNLDRFGNTPVARTNLLLEARRLKGLLSIEISAGGTELSVVHTGGIQGGIPLVSRDGLPTLQTPGAGRTLRTQPQTRSGTAAANSVLIWDPGFFGVSEGESIEEVFKSSEDPEYVVTAIRGTAADIDSVRTFFNYNTLVMVTHGGNNTDRQVGFMTAEEANSPNILKYEQELRDGDLKISGAFLSVMDGFIRKLSGSMNNGFVYNGSCVSARFGDQLGAAFLSKGANSYVGYTRMVGDGYAKTSGQHLFCNMLLEGQEVIDALLGIENLSEAGIPINLPTDSLDIRDRENAESVLIGAGDFSYETTFFPFDLSVDPSRLIFLQGGKEESIRVSLDVGMSECVKFDWTKQGSLLGGFQTDESTALQTTAADGGDRVTFALDKDAENGNAEIAIQASGKYSDNEIGSATVPVELVCSQLKGEFRALLSGGSQRASSVPDVRYAVDAGDSLAFEVNIPEECDVDIEFNALACGSLIDPDSGASAYTVVTKNRSVQLSFPSSCPEGDTLGEGFEAYLSVAIRNPDDENETLIEYDEMAIEVVDPGEFFSGTAQIRSVDYGSSYNMGAFFLFPDNPSATDGEYCLSANTFGSSNNFAAQFANGREVQVTKNVFYHTVSGQPNDWLNFLNYKIIQIGTGFSRSSSNDPCLGELPVVSGCSKADNQQRLEDFFGNWTFKVRPRPASGCKR